ncbi:DUF3606 domain-containing protein [Mucilaginibacter sp.]
MDYSYISGTFDRFYISLKENFEVEYWMNKLGVNREVLQEAVATVGNSADAVEKYLK